MKTVTLKISDDMSTRLSLLARQGGTNRSEIIRKALQEYLSREQQGVAGSFFEMAEDIVGCVDGPPDLSRNKARLAGYGK